MRNCVSVGMYYSVKPVCSGVNYYEKLCFCGHVLQCEATAGNQCGIISEISTYSSALQGFAL